MHFVIHAKPSRQGKYMKGYRPYRALCIIPNQCKCIVFVSVSTCTYFSVYVYLHS